MIRHKLRIALLLRVMGTVALVVAMTACATLPADAPQYSRAPEPAAGRTNVYIYRIGAYPTLRTPKISIDGAHIFDPPERSYTVVTLTPGDHEVRVKWSWDTGWPSLRFNIRVGSEPLYLKISGSFVQHPGLSFEDAGSFARVVPQVYAEPEIASCCRYTAPVTPNP